MGLPNEITELIERFDRNRDSYLSQIVHFDKIAGRYEGSKSLVAAPLWAERYHVHPEAVHLIP